MKQWLEMRAARTGKQLRQMWGATAIWNVRKDGDDLNRGSSMRGSMMQSMVSRHHVGDAGLGSCLGKGCVHPMAIILDATVE